VLKIWELRIYLTQRIVNRNAKKKKGNRKEKKKKKKKKREGKEKGNLET